jgi:galactokinase
MGRDAARAFADRFGRPAEWVVVAPGRVNLIGEHTDYNDGFVLPMAIERYVGLAAARAPARTPPCLRVCSAAFDETVDVPIDAAPAAGDKAWPRYVKGVVAGFLARALAVPDIDLVVLSDVPLGGGLSSSAALEVAVATLLEEATGHRLGSVEKARLCQTAEHDYAGVPCGLMDPLICILGDCRGPLLIDCLSDEATLVSLADPGVSVIVCNTRVRHALGDGAYGQRRAECEGAARELGARSLRDATLAMVESARETLGPVGYRRARHVVTENARTLEAARALERGDFEKVGQLFYESHRSLRDDYEVSCFELDVVVAAAGDLGALGGVYGARMTGGGFGGCAVVLARTDHVSAVIDGLCQRFDRETSRELETFVSRPAAGARRLDILPLRE